MLHENKTFADDLAERNDEPTRRTQTRLFIYSLIGDSAMRDRRRTKAIRPLRLERMESRRLLAADAFSCQDDSTDSIAAAASEVASASSFTASDAGSTRATAMDLGAVDGSVRINGDVSYWDRSDVFRFELSRDGEVELDLTGLRRNADLFITNAAGRFIQTSQSGGARSESLSLDLTAGEYFVGVQTRSFWGTRYQLGVTTTLDPIAPIAPTPTPIDPSPTDPSPTDIPTSAPNDQPDNSTSQPFADVGYFGGSRDWNINAVNAPESWAAGYTGQGVLVAVVDTGVDLDHPDLAGSIYVNAGEIAGDGVDNDGNGYIDDVNGYDFAGRDADPNDFGGHGTHVAGTIAAANNGFGATGVAHGATILPVRVLGDNGSGSTNDVAAGIRYAADLGADIINLSLGGGYSRVIDAAIEYARGVGSFIVAAAGNESASVPSYPARFSTTDTNVLSVGAHNQSSRIAGFSNDVGGSNAVQVDAPGVGVYSTYVGGRYASLSGTSMASPHVAGVAALALSANPDLSPDQLRSLLVGGVTGQAVGSDALGQINAATTVAYASRGFTAAPIASGSSTVSGNRSAVSATRFVATWNDEARVTPSLPTQSKVSTDTRIATSEDHESMLPIANRTPSVSPDSDAQRSRLNDRDAWFAGFDVSDEKASDLSDSSDELESDFFDHIELLT